MQIKQVISTNILDGYWEIRAWRMPKKAIFPIALCLFVVIGLLSPLFDLHHIHGFPGVKLYSQHLFWDSAIDATGFYAATFCKHWYHRIPIAIGGALIGTYILITLVG